MSSALGWTDGIRLSDAEIDRLIEEDLRVGDMTTRNLDIGNKPGRMTFAARQEMILCGVDEACRILDRLDVEICSARRTGDTLDGGTMLLETKGSAAALLAGWKIAQIIMEWASGIATAAHRIVTAARKVVPNIAVLCTRKSVPFTRPLSLKAVLAGGAEIHRLGLSDSIMVFPEHRVFWNNVDDLAGMITQLRARAPERMVMVEVTSEEDALVASEAMADVIQLEKFSPDSAGRITRQIRKRPDNRPIIAAAGGINAETAALYAAQGVDTLVTSAPFYAKPADIQVRILTA